MNIPDVWGNSVKKSKLVLTIVLAVIILVVIVLLITMLLTDTFFMKHKAQTSDVALINADCSDEELIEYSKRILTYLHENDYDSLSKLVHPEFGVIFSPYATVNLSSDMFFTPKEIMNFNDDAQKYIWGIYDGIGDPIELTVSEYFARFVNDVDFTKCENFGINKILRASNSLENISEVFPNCRYIDCYIPDANDPENGFNWKSLRLVFEENGGKLYLTAIGHNEYTV